MISSIVKGIVASIRRGIVGGGWAMTAFDASPFSNRGIQKER